MAKLTLLNARIFAGAADLTGVSNKVTLACETEEKDVTAFRPAGSDAGWKELLGGLFSTSIDAGGQWEATTDPQSIDPSTWDNLSARRNQPWTVCPESAGIGDPAWFTNALRTSYTLGDQAGAVAPWEAKAAGTSPLLRGVVAHPPGTPRTASGSGAGLNLGGLTATQRLYAGLHVLSIAGTATPSITVRVESSADNSWASPTTRATFAAASASATDARGQFVSVAGPVTDAWWRVAFTVAGTSPSFLFLASLGIA